MGRSVALMVAASLPFVAVRVGAETPARPPDPLYPAAQCAAFVLGRDDYARQSAYLTRTPGDVAFAAAFHDVAVRQNGGKAAVIDAYIASERPLMAFLFEAFIFGGDRQSRDLHDRLVKTCEDFGLTQPETRALRP